MIKKIDLETFYLVSKRMLDKNDYENFRKY